MKHAGIFLALLPLASAIAGDQPQWGQAYSRNMASAETGLPGSLEAAMKNHLRWQADLGTSSYSTPVVARGKVLIGTNNGNPRDPRHRGDRGVLMCFDEASGQFLWHLVVPKQSEDPYLDCPGVGITSSAAIEQDRAYIVSNRGEVICLDLQGMSNGNDGPYLSEGRHMTSADALPMSVSPADADILWLFDMRREVAAYTHDSANVSVLLHGPCLYVCVPSGVDYTHRRRPAPQAPGLIALDKQTGKLLAQDDLNLGPRVFHSTFSTPSLGVVRGRPQVFFGGPDGVLYAFEALSAPAVAEPAPAIPAKLRLLWQFDCDPAAPKENISQYQGNRRESPSSIHGMPVFHESHVYVAVGGDPWHGKRQAWLKCIDATKSGDITGSGEVWSYPLQRHCIATPAIAQGLVFIGDLGNVLHCVDAATGRALWTHDAKGEFWASPLVADGKVFAGTREGEFLVLAAARSKKLLSSIELNHPIYGSPVAANGVLFLSTMRQLFAVGGKMP